MWKKAIIVVGNEVLLCRVIDPVTLTFDLWTSKQYHFYGIPRSFPTPSLHTLGSFVFELCCRQTKTNRQTDKQTTPNVLPTPTVTDLVWWTVYSPLVTLSTCRRQDKRHIYDHRRDFDRHIFQFSVHSLVVLTRTRYTDKLYQHHNANINKPITWTMKRTNVFKRTRSSSLITIVRPSSFSSLKITDRSFRYASPSLWNNLPASFRQPRSSSVTIITPSITSSLFYSILKTHLFHKFFPP